MPEGSTKRRGGLSGRHRTGQPSSSQPPQYRPGVHPIMSDSRSDSPRSHKPQTQTSSRHANDTNDTVVNQPQNDPQIERQEILEKLDSGSREQPSQLTPRDDVIDRYVEEDLGITDPDSQPQPTGSAATGFTPTIGRPDKRGKAGESRDNNQKSDSQTPDSGEKESLSSIINRKRDERLKANQEKYEPKSRKGLSKLNFVGRGRSRIKKAIIAATISAFAAGAVAIVGVLPSAIESILTGATTSYSNFSTEGVIKKVFNDYFKEDVLLPKCRERTGNNPALTNRCNVGTSKKDGLFGRAREDFRANKMDQKLLDQGIQWDYDPDTDRYIVFVSKDGKAIPDFSKGIDYSSFDVFDLGKEEGSKFIDSKVRETINNESRWKKYFIRGPTLRAMRTRTGSTGCFFLCKAKDSFNNKKKWPKRAFGRFVKQHLLSPSSDLLAKIVECLISDGNGCTSRSVTNYARGKIGEAAAKLFNEEFAQQILKAFDGVLDKGVTRYILEKALEKLITWISGKVSTAAASNIAGIILFMFAVGKLAHTATHKLPRLLRIKNLMILSAASATFMVMINEARRGTMPLADFGAMLSTFIGMGSSRIFASMFMGPDNKTAQNGQPYSCNNSEDGGIFGSVSELITPSKIQPGELTCKSFKYDYTPDFLDNPLIKGASETYELIATACIKIPILGIEVCGEKIMDKLNDVVDKISQWVAGIFEKIPGFNELQGFLNSKIEGLTGAILGALSPSLVTDVFSGVTPKLAPQGARVFDALAGGASGINQYFTARDEIGGLTLSPTTQLELDNEIAQQQAQDTRFASRYDRFFNLDSTTGPGPSLLAQLSASTPANYSVASLFNPMKNLSLAFTSASGQNTYASNASNASLISGAFATPVKGHPLTYINGISKGSIPIEDPDSEKCQKEIATWKQQIEDRTDSLDSTKADKFGYGIPDGDGSGASPCLLADTSLKVLTTNRTTTDDFPYGESPQDGDESGGSGPSNPDEPVVGDTSETQCKEGSNDAGIAEGWLKGKKYSIRLCTIAGFTSVSDEDGGLARFNSTISSNVVNMVRDAKAAGKTTSVTSSFRSYAKQAELVACAPGCTGGNPVAAAGYSNHQMGFAIDVGMNSNSSFNLWLRGNGSKYGYEWYGSGDPPHFSVNGK